jgi:AraC-like DNA-binding protein
MTKKKESPPGKKAGAPKGKKKTPEHAEKLKEAGKLGGRPRRRVIYEKRILEPGEKVELPAPDIVLEELLFFIKVQGTEEEIAAHYFMSVDTLNRRLKDHFNLGFADIKNQCQAGGKLGLRVNQYNQSKNNTNMSKHLGECWLGQKSSTKVEITNVGEPVYLPKKKKINE